jgi:hypothetical protein
MKLLGKTWFRAIISLFAGSLIMEFINLSSRDPNQPIPFAMILLMGLVVYGILTFLVKKLNKP